MKTGHTVGRLHIHWRAMAWPPTEFSKLTCFGILFGMTLRGSLSRVLSVAVPKVVGIGLSEALEKGILDMFKLMPWLLTVALVSAAVPTTALAYIGPGVGAGAIAAVIGVLGSIFLARVAVR